MLAFVLKQVKMKYCSDITQTHNLVSPSQGKDPGNEVDKHEDIYHTWLSLANENSASRYAITSRLNCLECVDDFACVCIEFRFHWGHVPIAGLLLCLLLCLRFAGCSSPSVLRRVRFADCASPTALRRMRFAECASPSALLRVRFAQCASPSALRQVRFAEDNAQSTISVQCNSNGFEDVLSQAENAMTVFNSKWKQRKINGRSLQFAYLRLRRHC